MSIYQPLKNACTGPLETDRSGPTLECSHQVRVASRGCAYQNTIRYVMLMHITLYSCPCACSPMPLALCSVPDTPRCWSPGQGADIRWRCLDHLSIAVDVSSTLLYERNLPTIGRDRQYGRKNINVV